MMLNNNQLDIYKNAICQMVKELSDESELKKYIVLSIIFGIRSPVNWTSIFYLFFLLLKRYQSYVLMLSSPLR